MKDIDTERLQVAGLNYLDGMLKIQAQNDKLRHMTTEVAKVEVRHNLLQYDAMAKALEVINLELASRGANTVEEYETICLKVPKGLVLKYRRLAARLGVEVEEWVNAVASNEVYRQDRLQDTSEPQKTTSL